MWRKFPPGSGAVRPTKDRAGLEARSSQHGPWTFRGGLGRHTSEHWRERRVATREEQRRTLDELLTTPCFFYTWLAKFCRPRACCGSCSRSRALGVRAKRREWLPALLQGGSADLRGWTYLVHVPLLVRAVGSGSRVCDVQGRWSGRSTDCHALGDGVTSAKDTDARDSPNPPSAKNKSMSHVSTLESTAHSTHVHSVVTHHKHSVASRARVSHECPSRCV